MYPDIMLGTWKISAYVLFTYLAFFAALAYTYPKLIYVEKISQKQVLIYLVLIFFVQQYGGQLIPAIYRWYQHKTLPLNVIWKNPGRYFHSVVLSTIAFIIIYCKINKWATNRILDYFAIAAALMSAIGRIGCFLNGCCGGRHTSLPWGVIFPNDTNPVHPTQLYHFGFELFILFPLLIWINKRKRFEGETFWMFVWIYSFFRFWIEFLRTNMRVYAGLTHAQIFSAVAVFVSGIILIRKYRKSKAV